MTPLELAALAALGAVLFLDQWAAFQTMASRPIVAGVLVGAVLGRPAEGALWGGAFEAMFLGTLPVGAARHLDVAVAAIAGTTVALVGREGDLYPAGLAVAVALVAGRIGEWGDHAQRRWNASSAERVRQRVAAGDPGAPGWAVTRALFRGAAVGAAQTALSVGVGITLWRLLRATAWVAPLPTRGVIMVALVAAAVGGARLFGPRRADAFSRVAVWGTGAAAGAGLAVWTLAS